LNDSKENLALSTTFIWKDGAISQGSSYEGADSAGDLLKPGTVVDSKYRIIGLIAYGGIGAVYKVHHLLLQKDMALKTFLSKGLSQASWLRFQREAQAIAKLKHKGIVDVFDFGIAGGQMPYYTMELLEGKSLAHAIYQSGHLDPPESMRLFAQIADALAHAHRQNIVHRDIKPANIMLVAPPPGQKGPRQAKVVDFGVAKLAADENQEQTQIGTVFGSPLYMSPEQSLGQQTDHRTDIYSFGCSLYEALTGEPPFVGKTAIETMHCHQVVNAPTLKDSGVECEFSSRLEATVAKMLAKKTEDRFQSFDEVIVELKRCARNVQRQTPHGALVAYKKNAASEKSGKAWIGSGTRDADKMTAFVTALGKKPALIGLSLLSVCVLAGIIAMSLGLGRGRSAPAMSRIVTPDTDTVVNSNTQFTKPVKVVPTIRRYFICLRKDADGLKKIFDFPPDELAGTLSLVGEHTVLPCSGRVVVPARAKLVLNAGEGPFTKPELFRRFGADDLYGITLAPQMMSSKEGDWSDKHIEEISRLTGLQSIDFSRSLTLSPKIAKSLNKLKNLKRLVMPYSNVTAEMLEGLTIMPQIEYLDISNLSNLTPVLTEMSNKNCRLESLIANYCVFNAKDFQLIGSFKKLKLISLVGCGLTDRAMAYLAPAATLESLNLSHNKLDQGVIPYLARYRSLKDLSLNLSQFGEFGFARLKQALPPRCTVENLDD